jgi:hypothetical protein
MVKQLSTSTELTSASFVPKAKPIWPAADTKAGAAARAVAATVEKRIIVELLLD